MTVVFLLVLAFVSFPLSANPSPEAFERECLTQFSAERPSKRPLTYERLKNLVEKERIASPEALLRRLGEDEEDRALLGSYALVFNSRSVHGPVVSRKHPRVLFFKDELVLAVTGNPSPRALRLNNQIEVIQYRRDTHRFDFKVISFNRQPARFVEKPGSCVNCHGADELRPMWFTYHTWPGVFRAGNAFEKTPGSGSLYDLLQPSRYGESAQALLSFLNRLNFDRIRYRVESTPNFDRYRYAFGAALLDCPGIPTYFGNKTLRRQRELELGMNWWETDQETRYLLDYQYKDKVDYAREIHDEEAATFVDRNDDADLGRFIALRYLFDGRGTEVGEWSLNFAPADDYGFGFHELGIESAGIRQLVCQFFPRWVREDASLAPLLKLHGDAQAGKEDTGEACALLKRRSIEAFARP